MSEIWTILLGLGDKLAAHIVLAASAIAPASRADLRSWSGKAKRLLF